VISSLPQGEEGFWGGPSTPSGEPPKRSLVSPPQVRQRRFPHLLAGATPRISFANLEQDEKKKLKQTLCLRSRFFH
jgi:hypothetical protein